jgi:hypothetical protein
MKQITIALKKSKPEKAAETIQIECAKRRRAEALKNQIKESGIKYKF